MRTLATPRLFFAAARCFAFDAEIGVDLLELDVRVVVGLDRLGEASLHALDLGHDRLRLCPLRRDRLGGRRSDGEQDHAGGRRSENDYRRPSGARASLKWLSVVSEQTRRWRSGPSQVGDPSRGDGRLQPATKPKYLQKASTRTGCVRVARSWVGERAGGAPRSLRFAATLVGAGGSAFGQPQEPQAYRIKVDAVAYFLPGKTALGVPVQRGVVAVDPSLIPLGTKHVPGYGPGLAADVGHAIKGRIIDLWFPSTARAREWGRRTVTITVYR